MYLVKGKTTKENAQSIIKQGIRSTFLIGFRQTKDERLKIADLRRGRHPSSSAAPLIASGEAFASTGAEPECTKSSTLDGVHGGLRPSPLARERRRRNERSAAPLPPENWAPRMGRSQYPRSAGVLVRSDTGDGPLACFVP